LPPTHTKRVQINICVILIARYIIVNAGNIDGFIPNIGRIFRSKKKSGDYHSEMNAETFEEWLKDMLLALDKPSLIILDNASYHSRLHEKQPTTAWRKSELQNWLRENNILYSALDTKNSLLQICRANYREKVCEVDCIIREAGHEVLRLPPYHCMFNPIEMVWSQSKRLYDKKFSNQM
jgi:transposase